jgi:hypothetical protein
MTRRYFLKFTAAMGVLFSLPLFMPKPEPMPQWERELRAHCSPGFTRYPIDE